MMLDNKKFMNILGDITICKSDNLRYIVDNDFNYFIFANDLLEKLGLGKRSTSRYFSEKNSHSIVIKNRVHFVLDEDYFIKFMKEMIERLDYLTKVYNDLYFNIDRPIDKDTFHENNEITISNFYSIQDYVDSINIILSIKEKLEGRKGRFYLSDKLDKNINRIIEDFFTIPIKYEDYLKEFNERKKYK